jgi:HSP20 family protein
MTEEREERQGTYLLRERRQGQFMRAVALPGMVEVDQVRSDFEDGQLTITLPKASQNRARRIEIPTNTGKSGNGRHKAGATGTQARPDQTSQQTAQQTSQPARAGQR